MLAAVNLSERIGELACDFMPFGYFVDWLDLKSRCRIYLRHRHDLLRRACLAMWLIPEFSDFIDWLDLQKLGPVFRWN
jgi:hypothetical protein